MKYLVASIWGFLSISCLSAFALAQETQQTPAASDSAAPAITRPENVPSNPAIDYEGFLKLAEELAAKRESHRVPIKRFVEMAGEPNTIILDTRSKWAYDVVHLADAVHLNFSDFTQQKLRKVIPDKRTRILIYCNNNFATDVVKKLGYVRAASGTLVLAPASAVTRQEDDIEEIVESGAAMPKTPTLALNIPTFINLHGYGYQNVYELADQLPLDDPRLSLEGSAVKPTKRSTVSAEPAAILKK